MWVLVLDVGLCCDPFKDCSRHGVKLATLTLAVHVQQPTSSGKRDREKAQYLRSNGSRRLRVCMCVFLF